MAFSKAFPKRTDKTVYPRWEDVFLTKEEESQEEERARQRNVELMKQCVDDAKHLMKERLLKDYETNLIRIAIALFEKRASHAVYFKERLAKEKFDREQQK